MDKKTNMSDLFKKYFSAPFLLTSPSDTNIKFHNFVLSVIDNGSLLLNKKCSKWFLENFIWFYDKKILNSLFSVIGTPIELAEKIYSCGEHEACFFE